MPKASPRTVDEYIAAQPKRARDALLRVRQAIRKALPRAKEVVSYKIPAYKIGDRTIVYFAGWARHYALYPFGQRVVEKFRSELVPYKVIGSTIRFPLTKPVPSGLIARLAKFRAKDIATHRPIAKKDRPPRRIEASLP